MRFIKEQQRREQRFDKNCFYFLPLHKKSVYHRQIFNYVKITSTMKNNEKIKKIKVILSRLKKQYITKIHAIVEKQGIVQVCIKESEALYKAWNMFSIYWTVIMVNQIVEKFKTALKKIIGKLLFCTILILPILCCEINSISKPEQYVLVYNDKGVCIESFTSIIKWLRTMPIMTCKIKQVDSSYIINENWEKDTKLLIIPGGADIPYHQALKGVGCRKIRKFVENGGSYLGICAGAYFGGAKIEFALGSDIEVAENRELHFFEGITAGPVIGTYVYDSEAGACAAKVNTKNASFMAYYNGGCTFKATSVNSFKNVDILAKFGDLNLPAIIICRVKKGLVALSGVHLEYFENLLAKNKNPKIINEILPAIKKTENIKKEFCELLIQKLLKK